MKIGILTYHRSHNYGALLQAVATRFVLEQMGHEVYYVDYWPDYHRRMYALVNTKILFGLNVRRTLSYLKLLCLTYKSQKRRRQVMENFIRHYIEPYCLPVDSVFDVTLYGSDQIWRKQPEMDTYNPVYFGVNDFKAKKRISYAASMGILPNSDTDREKVKELIGHLDALSVREDSLARLIHSFGVTDVRISLDPTLLLNRKQWDEVIKPKAYMGSKYALFYDLLPNSFTRSQIENFTKDHELQLKTIYGYALRKETDEEICSISADGFLDLIRNADFVFTSSFHGLVFSILYNKPFYASFSKNSGRAESILSALGLQEYLLKPQSLIPNDFKAIDYNIVSEKMDVLRVESLNYLKVNTQN